MDTSFFLPGDAVLPGLSLMTRVTDWLAQYGIGDDPRELTLYFVLSLIQIAVIGLIMRPLEDRYPCESWPDRKLTGIDRLYTLLKLLVVVPVVSFIVMPWLEGASGGSQGEGLLQLDRLFPVLAGHAFLTFLIYFVVNDLVFYVVHRLQHAVPWWWGLHSLHHSQRQLSCWSNDRDHYLDDLFEMLILAGVGAVLGVPPVDYALVLLAGKLLEEFSHANVRFGFGAVANKLLVDPHFHRLHHMRVDSARPNLHNCNFSLVFPVWDILFGTALYNEAPRPCGVDDPAVDADNDLGVVGQQLAGLRRFANGFRRRPRAVSSRRGA
jgi:sterol desaturase/sphingolipid hydroxylase (fatty acid hydroxylase superfamily)